MRIRNAVVTLVGGSALASAALAQEQPEDTDELGSIVVSAPQYVSTGSRAASKSDIPLVETPQSVTVVSRDMIDLLNWTSLNESV